MKILVIDVGGTHVKVLATGRPQPMEFDSGLKMTPAQMVKDVKRIAASWSYSAVSIGFPGMVVHGRIASEPLHLGPGWIGFDFEKALGRPVRIINDAAMQALGSYHGGRMLFLGLGTGLGSAMIVDGVVQPMELAHLPYKKNRSYEDYLGLAGLKRLGKKRWRQHVWAVVDRLRAALEPDEVVIGGGNVTKLGGARKGIRFGKNANAFAGGYRLWQDAKALSGTTAK